jgi:hypothetical protein
MAADGPEDDPVTERRDGPTPNGGVASVIHYRAADGDPCPRSRAVAAEVHELDASGDSIARTYAELGRAGRP